MADRILPEDMFQIVHQYMSMGSTSKGLAAAEVILLCNRLDALEKVEPTEQSVPKLVKGKGDVSNG